MCFSEMRAKSVLSYMVGVLATLSAGSLFSLEIFTPSFKTLFDLTQWQCTVVSGLGMLGFASAFLVSCLLAKLTAMWLCVWSCVLSTLGFLLMWSGTKAVHFYEDKVWLLGFYSFLAGNGIAYLYLTSLTIALKNSPKKHWGKIIGGLHSMLSIGILGVDAINLYVLDYISSSLLIYLALIVVANLFGIAFLRLDRAQPPTERAMSDDVRELTSNAIEYAPSDAGSSVGSDDEDRTTSPHPATIQQSGVRNRSHEAPSCADFCPTMVSCQFFSLTASFVFAVGAALSVAWNLSDMLAHFFPPPDRNPSLALCVFAGFSACFAIFAGCLRDLGIPQGKMATLSALMFTLIGVFTCVFVETRGMWTVYAGSAGVVFGSFWSLIPVAIAGKFGAKRFPLLWCTVLVITVVWALAIQCVNLSFENVEMPIGSARLSVIVQSVVGFCAVICSLNIPNA